jgi:hypothetical protein
MKSNIEKAIALLNEAMVTPFLHDRSDKINAAISLFKREDEARQPLVPDAEHSALVANLNRCVNSKLLITIEDGKIKSVIANGNAELFVNNLDSLEGVQKVSAREVGNERFGQIVADMEWHPPMTPAEHNMYPKGRNNVI